MIRWLPVGFWGELTLLFYYVPHYLSKSCWRTVFIVVANVAVWEHFHHKKCQLNCNVKLVRSLYLIFGQNLKTINTDFLGTSFRSLVEKFDQRLIQNVNTNVNAIFSFFFLMKRIAEVYLQELLSIRAIQ